MRLNIVDVVFLEWIRSQSNANIVIVAPVWPNFEGERGRKGDGCPGSYQRTFPLKKIQYTGNAERDLGDMFSPLFNCLSCPVAQQTYE